MKSCLRIVCVLLLVTGTLTQDEFNLADAIDDPTPSPTIKQPAAKPKPDEFNLADAFDDPTPSPPIKQPAAKPKPDDTKPKTDKPAVVPPKSGGGGGRFDDSDLSDVGAGDYKPDGGRSGGRAVDPGSDTHGDTEQTQDPDYKWDQVLKLLYANVPEEFYVWMSNMKQVLEPLVERVQDLLQALP